jgi:hypothetical protein
MKYAIEGNIDFYSELSKLDEKEDITDESMLCLISRLPLTADYVRMECGHQFNYMPLYNDLVHQTKPSMSGMSKPGRIVCPFCRHSQPTLLPFRIEYKPVIGVNLYPHKLCKGFTKMIPATCPCEFSSHNLCSAYVYEAVNGKHYCDNHRIIGVSVCKQEASHSDFLKKHKKATKTNEKKLNSLGCSQTLKTGPNKGNPCGCKKLVSGTTVCLRHNK